MLSGDQERAAIATHADALAREVDGHLDAPVASCPGWDVAALLEHLVGVHWFWTRIVEERLIARDEGERPAPPAREELVETFVRGAQRMVSVLAEADPTVRVWTWAPSNQTVGFVSRHQVQEMVVHHVDGASAVGATVVIEPVVALDCVDEFLTYSLSSPEDPKDPRPAPLGAPLVLRATDGDGAWTLRDAPTPGLLLVESGAEAGAATVAAPGSDLLLWLYRRIELETPGVDADLIARFRDLTYTD